MSKIHLTLLALVLSCVAAVHSASAVPIAGLFNTGLGSSANYLAAGQPDAHYFVNTSPSGPFTPVAIDDTNYPFGPWVPNNSPFSRWIGPTISSQGPAGAYHYETTFNLPSNANLSTAMITGDWGTDDWSLDIWLNGTPQGQVSGGFSPVLVPFMVNSGFVFGPNVLEFRLNNAGGPTGLRVDNIRGKYNLIPEPASLSLAAGCVVVLFALRRRVCD